MEQWLFKPKGRGTAPSAQIQAILQDPEGVAHHELLRHRGSGQLSPRRQQWLDGQYADVVPQCLSKLRQVLSQELEVRDLPRELVKCGLAAEVLSAAPFAQWMHRQSMADGTHSFACARSALW
jgi:hypothetical protein